MPPNSLPLNRTGVFNRGDYTLKTLVAMGVAVEESIATGRPVALSTGALA